MKILVLGGSGMLGFAVSEYLSSLDIYNVAATLRRHEAPLLSSRKIKFYFGVDALKFSSIQKVFEEFQPNVVINCMGAIKQDIDEVPVSQVIETNSLVPHKLAELTTRFDARLITFSTDCVFTGSRGAYTEESYPDSRDIYGHSKLMGEVDYGNSLTIRTSLIGMEIYSNKSLLSWFLTQKRSVQGYRNAYFSGFPVNEIAKIIHEKIINNDSLRGVLHLSSDRISKHDLLTKIAYVYGKQIEINPVEDPVIDRSLNSEKFRQLATFVPDSWSHMLMSMKDFYFKIGLK
jgi:dTDP-4-dehydrorhamnose reductase